MHTKLSINANLIDVVQHPLIKALIYKKKNTNYLKTNSDDATFSINIPISKNFQTKIFLAPLSSNPSSVPPCFIRYVHLSIPSNK